MSDSARLMNSTGTNQRRPLLAVAAGSETRRPDTDANA